MRCCFVCIERRVYLASCDYKDVCSDVSETWSDGEGLTLMFLAFCPWSLLIPRCSCRFCLLDVSFL